MRKSALRSSTAFCFVVGTALSTASTGHAQTSGKIDALVDEILVVAQKKGAAERVQDVPIAMTAFSGAKVDAMLAEDLSDIGLSVPNASLTEQVAVPAVANFSIRGMGTVGQTIPSSDPSVGVIIDGVPLGTIYGVVTDVFDLESVEILRGPQGTLFGRNVTGGAVVMRTARPTNEFKGGFNLTLGSHSTREVKGAINTPLGANLAGKLAVLYKSNGDYWKSTNPAIKGMGTAGHKCSICHA